MLEQVSTKPPQPSTPFADHDFGTETELIAPMTPKKKLDACLPIVNTPTSTAVIRSIVQSARKTGLHSSPIRVPFALSPMAKSLAHIKHNMNTSNGALPLSPIKFSAKSPSQPIKEAFLSFDELGDDQVQLNAEDLFCLPFNNKRAHESDTERNIFDESADLIDCGSPISSHQNKKEKLDLQPEEHKNEAQTEKFEYSDEKQAEYDAPSNTFDIHNNDQESNASSSSDSFIDNSNSLDHLPPSSFSTDLLNNSKDPELKSPELLSAIDTTRSKSETQDSHNRDNAQSSSLKKSRSNSSSTSSSSASTSTHPLLPSGIIKLLEKKRLEREKLSSKDHQTSTDSSITSTTSLPATNKKKFDLKESLKRPLNYKPHLGSNFPPKME